MAYPRGLAGLGVDELKVGNMDAGLLLDDAALRLLCIRLGVLADEGYLLHSVLVQLGSTKCNEVGWSLLDFVELSVAQN